MQTIKTGVVVALLLAVCYGAFVALNAPEPDLPEELLSEFDWSPEEAGLENLTSVEMPSASFQVPSDSALPATGGKGTFDTSGLSLPPLPSPSSSSSGMSSSQAQGTSLAPVAIDSPLPKLANVDAAGATSNNPLEGPSVSLPDASQQVANLTTGTTADLGTASPASGYSASALPTGQLVARPRSELSAGDNTMALPLLNGSANGRNESGSPQEQPTIPFPDARDQALELASNGKLRDALQVLTRYYDSPELNREQHIDLLDMLDALSKEVVYSPRHLAESPYTVTAGDTIESVATKYQITPELLSAINGLGNSRALLNGSQIKVLSGPFRAVVSLSRNELTVFMGDLYAGRFAVSFGTDPSPVEGTFEIIDRRRDRTYYGTGGKVIGAGDNRNPYGGYWLNLGQEMCIHGTPEMASDDLQGAGCISLAPLDAADVYSILTQTNQVSIVR